MGSAPASILVVDDHPVFRAGMVAVLSRLEGVSQVREAGDVRAGWAAIEARPPSCATVDLQLPDGNGFTLVKRARARGYPTRFVVVSLFDDEALRSHAQALGASEFVPKHEDPAGVVAAVRRVLAQPPPRFAPAEVEPITLDERLPLLGALSRLTPAERLVLRLLADNLTSTQIATRLGLSPRTVQNHRAHICDKLGLRGNHKLLEVALELRDALGDADDGAKR